MPQPGRRTITCLLLLCVLAVAALAPTAAQSGDISRERQHYADAVKAIDRGDWQAYERLRASLNDYPLAIYLDYFKRTRQNDRVTPLQAQEFLRDSNDTPLPNRFLAVYLRQAGEAHRWQDFLQVKADEPNSVDLKCYFFRAQLAQGEKALAWKGARELWVQGHSQPRACDPLFAAWQSSGALTDEIVWTRLLNAFAAGQSSLLHYVAKLSSTDLRPWSDRLLAVYHNPETLSQQSLAQDSPYSADIVSHGLTSLARSSPSQALSYWRDYQQRIVFSPVQVQDVEFAIAQQSLFARTASNSGWLEEALARLTDDKLVGIRLRWALSEQDWTGLERYMRLLID